MIMHISSNKICSRFPQVQNHHGAAATTLHEEMMMVLVSSPLTLWQLPEKPTSSIRLSSTMTATGMDHQQPASIMVSSMTAITMNCQQHLLQPPTSCHYQYINVTPVTIRTIVLSLKVQGMDQRSPSLHHLQFDTIMKNLLL